MENEATQVRRIQNTRLHSKVPTNTRGHVDFGKVLLEKGKTSLDSLKKTFNMLKTFNRA